MNFIKTFKNKINKMMMFRESSDHIRSDRILKPYRYNNNPYFGSRKRHTVINGDETKIIRFKINVARRVSNFLKNTPSVIVSRYYSGLKDETDETYVKKRAMSYFSKVLGKNVFSMLANGNNIFDGKREYDRDEMIRDYDKLWFQKKLNTRIEDFRLYGKVFDFRSIKLHTVNVYKVYKDGFYNFHEWRDVISITVGQYNRLKEKYNHNWGLFLQYVFLMGFRYKALGHTNFHCSIPPDLIKKYNMGEFFGSPLNTFSDVYYSPFEDIEKYFGSRGNFFTSKVDSGVYLANPPFDAILVRKMFNKIHYLLQRVPNLTILINVPNYYDSNDKQLNFIKDITDNIGEKPYFVGKAILKKEKYMHFDYYNDKFIPVCNTQLILFSNSKTHLDLKTFRTHWKTILKNKLGEDYSGLKFKMVAGIKKILEKNRGW